jgi:hypothetical protein
MARDYTVRRRSFAVRETETRIVVYTEAGSEELRPGSPASSFSFAGAAWNT